VSLVDMGRGLVLIEASSNTNQLVLTRDNFAHVDARNVAAAFNEHIAALQSITEIHLVTSWNTYSSD